MTHARSLRDADARYLDDIRRDCEGCLGAGATLAGIAVEPSDGGVRLTATYRLGEAERQSSAIGETLLDAHRILRARILFDRIRYGFSDAVDRRASRGPRRSRA